MTRKGFAYTPAATRKYEAHGRLAGHDGERQQARMSMVEPILAAYAARQARTFPGGRDQTVGASENPQCIRRTWYRKHGAPRDNDRPDARGWTARGNLIEQHLVVP